MICPKCDSEDVSTYSTIYICQDCYYRWEKSKETLMPEKKVLVPIRLLTTDQKMKLGFGNVTVHVPAGFASKSNSLFQSELESLLSRYAEVSNSSTQFANCQTSVMFKFVVSPKE